MMQSSFLSGLSSQQLTPSASYRDQGEEVSLENDSRVHEAALPCSQQPMGTIISVQKNARPLSVKTTRTTSSVSVPVASFPFRNRTNLPSGTPNFLLQTILKESQQVKLEYQQYKRETQAKMSEQETVIRNLKENANLYQKKILELKLQKEVYVAREAHTFQEIQDSIQELLQKVSKLIQTESFKREAGLCSESPPIPGNVSTLGLAYSDVVANVKNLENRLADLEEKSEDVTLSSKVTEENFKLQAALTNEKLDQIIYYIMENRGLNSSEITTRGDTDASIYNASAEDNQDDSSDTSDIPASTSVGVGGTVTHHLSLPPEDLKPKTETQEDNKPIYEVPMLPIQIVLQTRKDSSSFSNNKKIAHRKRKSTYTNSASLKKRMCRRMIKRREIVMHFENDSIIDVEKKCSDGDTSSEKPPVLSLPGRIAKHSQKRSNSMPVLVPEEKKLSQQTKAEQPNDRKPQENRKDDALIGIKKENLSNELHGKDFSKMGYVCLCGAKFTGAGGLYVHQVKTMENEKFSCRSCGKKFHYFSGLKAHRKSAHKQEFTQEVGCSRCGQIFKSKRDRQGHLDERGQTCWLSGSYQSKDWEAIRSKRNLSLSSPSSSSSSQNTNV